MGSIPSCVITALEKSLVKQMGIIGRDYLRLRLITLTKTLIILDITKTFSNSCLIIHRTKKKWSRQ